MHIMNFWRTSIMNFYYQVTKEAEATCVEIAIEMKKYFRLKDTVNFNAL